jgi:hypothetical protein
MLTKKKEYYTDYLFSKSSFIDGLGSILDLSGSYYDFNYSNSWQEADSKAIKNDWGMVGNDIRDAKKVFKKSLPFNTSRSRWKKVS